MISAVSAVSFAAEVPWWWLGRRASQRGGGLVVGEVFEVDELVAGDNEGLGCFAFVEPIHRQAGLPDPCGEAGVTSLSLDARQNPLKRPEYSKSIASMISVVSVAFLLVV